MRVLISEECRELEERKKRVSSIIIRGIDARTPAALGPIFNTVATELIGSSVSLSDVVCISGDRGLFRAKVVNADDRMKLLDSARSLKNSRSFSSVYITRDLTYKQRQTLFARRANFVRDRNNNSTGGGDGVSVTGDDSQPPGSVEVDRAVTRASSRPLN